MNFRRSKDRWRPTQAETEFNTHQAESACLFMQGLTVNEVARQMGLDPTGVCRMLSGMGFATGPVGPYSRTEAGYRAGYGPHGKQTQP